MLYDNKKPNEMILKAFFSILKFSKQLCLNTDGNTILISILKKQGGTVKSLLLSTKVRGKNSPSGKGVLMGVWSSIPIHRVPFFTE